ncbi:MAG: hypothetical protein LBE49_03495, partial [Deltaproteobacteria bacterium]|nr:hypothetical protein [Deltaproteobacteria bacterium]
AQEGAQEGAQEAAQEVAQEAVQEAVQEAAQEGAQEAAQEGAQEAAQEGAQEGAQEAAQEAPQEAPQEAVQEGGQEAAKEGAQAAEGGLSAFFASLFEDRPWVFSTIGLFLIFLVVAALKLSGKGQAPAPPEGAQVTIGRSGRPIRISLEKDSLAGLFPSVWLSGASREGLAKWVSESAQEAAGVYLEALAAPGDAASRGQEAEAKLSAALRGQISAGRLLELLCGDSEPIIDPAVLSLHLSELMPTLRIPPPSFSVSPRPSAMALAAALGALAGDMLGGAAAVKLGQPLETGIMAGAALGAAAFILLALWLGLNEKVRRVALALIGGAAVLDTASQAALGPLAPIAGGGSYFKRLALYLGAGASLLLIKAKPSLERTKTRENAVLAILSWLEEAVSLAAVLVRKVAAPIGPAEKEESEELLAKIVPSVRTLLADPALRDSSALAELSRRLLNSGYEVSPKESAPTALFWDDGLRERYDTFGLVRSGQKVVVEEEPVIKDDRVIRKGLVVPEKG